MNDIINKLGMKPINWFKYDGYIDKLCYESDVREVEQQRNELLEALIGETQFTETSGSGWNYFANKELIEKITKLPFEKIKELK